MKQCCSMSSLVDAASLAAASEDEPATKERVKGGKSGGTTCGSGKGRFDKTGMVLRTGTVKKNKTRQTRPGSPREILRPAKRVRVKSAS